MGGDLRGTTPALLSRSTSPASPAASLDRHVDPPPQLARASPPRAEFPVSPGPARPADAERLRIALESAGVGVHVWWPASGLIEWDERVRELWGIGAAEPVDYGLFISRVHPADRAALQAAIDTAVDPAGDGLYRADFRVIGRDDGALRWIAATGRVTFQEGAAQCLIGTVRDVTDQRRAEEALRESEARFRTAISNAGIVPAACDRDLRYLWIHNVHPSFDPSVAIGRRDDEIVPMEDVAELVAIKRAVLDTGRPLRKEIGVRFNGAQHYYDVSARPLTGAHGAVVGVTTASVEITERRRAEDEVRRSAALLKAVSDSTPEAIYVKDRETRLLFANPPALRLLRAAGAEVNAADLIGRTNAEILRDPAQARAMTASDLKVIESGVEEIVEETLHGDDGPRAILSTKSPLRDEHGIVMGLVGISRDVTERHRAERALRTSEETLRHANRQKDEFIAMLAHELRNPLAPIRNAGELLARVVGAIPAAEAPLRMLCRQTQQLTRLVDDLLDASRLAQGRIVLQPEPLEIGVIIDHASETVQSLMREKGHRLELRKPLEPLFVCGDRARLVQSVCNVLHNAAKYTDPAGRIEIAVEADLEQVSLTIRDDGHGIAPELLPRVFDLFVQSERTLDRAQGGLGIGLSVVKRLVEMHGGTVCASSEGQGRGACFTIRLPRIPPPEAAVPPLAEPARVGCHVLVVDDNADAADSLALLLQLEGHSVETVYSAAAALEAAERVTPDVVLLDIGLPQMDGYEVARCLRSNRRLDATRIVALTGYGQREDRERSRAAGFDEHLVKPADLEALTKILSARPSAARLP